jgi:putative ABC transport system permease protein
MNGIIDIGVLNLAFGYALLIIPLAVIIRLKIPMVTDTVVSIVRMTIQLLFVGFYLQVIFDLNNPWLNAAWVLIMIVVADISIARGAGVRLSRFALPLFISLVVGTILPLLFFMGPIMLSPNLMEAQYVIPIGGMILGNCLRADIIGLSTFYNAIQGKEKVYTAALAQGARFPEAIRPFSRDAVRAALAPTVATMATIGLVSLPGMMTGVILGGADPMTAIKYQIAIMIAIFTGTSITVYLAIGLTARIGFDAYGMLKREIFREREKRRR